MAANDARSKKQYQKCILYFALAAGVIGFFVTTTGGANLAEVDAVKKELEGSVETTCKITQMDSTPCEIGDENGKSFSARAYVDICSEYFNHTIPWKGDVGYSKGCYINDSGLPDYGSFRDQIISWPCRVKCEEEVWYTAEVHDHDFVVILVLGILLLIFSLLGFYAYLFRRRHFENHSYHSICFKLFVLTACFQCWIVLFLCQECKETERKNNARKQAQEAKAQRQSNSQNNRLVNAIQGDWTNSDGLLISVKDKCATFLPSGNHYNFVTGGPKQVSIQIEGLFWKLVSFDTRKLESDPYFAKQIWWTRESDGWRPDQKMKWVRRELEPQDLPPSYQETYEETSGYNDRVELCVSAPPPPIYEIASAPPAYDVTPMNTAGVNKKWRPKTHPI